ncbi:MAG TPA: FAD-dependent oxidoreductase [Planctomycetaceae bacterium]|nr:FAD-dependent oxidoreductase [Planctomycetaceae bacterium]
MPMNRRDFVGTVTATALAGFSGTTEAAKSNRLLGKELQAEVIIVGGSLGGCAAALAALRNGLRVILTEETAWIGGQLTSQAVPPDEHRWIETHGANRSYRELRTRIREYYRKNYPLTEAARNKENLNPGNGSVSRLCHEPRVALAVLQDWFAPYLSGGRLTLLTRHRPVKADVDGDRIRAVTVRSLDTGNERTLTGPYFIDATELGDLLPLTGTEFVTGSEAKSDTNELHAADNADPGNQQAFTMCFPVEYRKGEDHTIEKPREYDFWKDFVPNMTPPWPGKLLDFTYTHPKSGEPRKLGFNPDLGKIDGAINLWLYRRIADAKNFEPGTYAGDISLINWPQNDYVLGNLIGVSADEQQQHIARAKQLSLSLMYWLQTEAPRIDGGQGYPGLRLRGDLVGTEDGLAMYPYIRESRRIKAMFTVLEEHVGLEQRAMVTGNSGAGLKAAEFADSVGVGSYSIDLHPSSGGDNYIDFLALPFQVPLGALIPQRIENLLAACKNIGVTHLTGGCYRLHPVEWGIGEAAACTVTHALANNISPRGIRETAEQLSDFQQWIQSQGVEIAWK